MIQIDKVIVPYQLLKTAVEQLFIKWGFSETDSRSITDVLITANLSGIDSHGIQRLGMYEKTIANGIVVLQNKPMIELETAVTALVNANRAMGQLAALFSMQLAIEKAKAQGIGIVVTKDSNHFGIAGYYAQLASKQNLIGICTTNSRAVMPATFGAVPLIGTNPVAFSFPNEPYDFLYDASSTVVSLGKIEVCSKAGKKLPSPWGLNQAGKPSSDPNEILDDLPNRTIGGVYPLGGPGEDAGGYKGYGQGLIVEILTAILSGGMSSDVISNSVKDGACHFFLALDPTCFGNLKDMKARLSAYFERLRKSNIADPKQRIYIHGEKEFEKRALYQEKGIPVDVEIWREFEAICRRNQVAI